MSLHGKTVVLTGASSGIGAETAMQLASRGVRVCLIARREQELLLVQTRIRAAGGQAWVYPCNLAEPADLDRCAQLILQEHPYLDALVNNAARSIRRPILESLDRPHDYERTIQLNYLAAVRLTLRLLPRFLQQGHGHIVNISTLSSQIPIPLFSAYLASKSALESFSRSLLAELGDQGISTTVVHFPMVRTHMSAKTGIYRHMRMLNPARAARWIIDALENRPVRLTTSVGKIGALAMAALPGTVTRLSQPIFRAMDQRLNKKLNKV